MQLMVLYTPASKISPISDERLCAGYDKVECGGENVLDVLHTVFPWIAHTAGCEQRRISYLKGK